MKKGLDEYDAERKAQEIKHEALGGDKKKYIVESKTEKEEN